MSYVNILLSMNVIPVIRHDSSSFKLFEEEAHLIAKGVLKQPIVFHVIRSEIANAYVIRLEDGHFVGITDTLLQELGFDVLELLSCPSISDFFARECGYSYDPAAPQPNEAEVRAGTARSMDESNAKIDLFNEIFRNMGTFLIFHEVGHIMEGHLDLTRPGAAFSELPQDGFRNESETSIEKEHQADSHAACWRGQQFMRRRDAVAKEAAYDAHRTLLACAALSAILPIRQIQRKAEGDRRIPATHPPARDRIANIFFWILVVLHADDERHPVADSEGLLARFLGVVEGEAKRLGWPHIDWEGFRPEPALALPGVQG